LRLSGGGEGAGGGNGSKGAQGDLLNHNQLLLRILVGGPGEIDASSLGRPSSMEPFWRDSLEHSLNARVSRRSSKMHWFESAGIPSEEGMRVLLSLVALLLLGSFAPPTLFREPPPPSRSVLTFDPVHLDERFPDRRQVGKLTFLGGWSIRSNDHRFGGISAMHVEAGEVTAVSDTGNLFRFAVPSGRRGELNVMPLPDGPGPATEKANRDAESLAVHRGRFWIAFEGSNEVWRYARDGSKAEAHRAPPEMRRWSGNGGSEAMVRLPDGRFLIFSESSYRPDGSTEALVFSGDPALARSRAERFGYAAPKGYKITDAAALPDGRLLFLNRSAGLAKGFTAILTLSDKAAPNAGGMFFGREIAHLRTPLTVDNMEALSVTIENGRTIVWIASDDNFLPLQRTLLLKFELAG
jgi:hypothetical protein